MFTNFLNFFAFSVHYPSVVFNGRHATGTSNPNRDLPHVKMAKIRSRPHLYPDFGLHGSCFRVHLRPQLPLGTNNASSVSTKQHLAVLELKFFKGSMPLAAS
jgi:hypothetical protein